jgi:hypothetical protein
MERSSAGRISFSWASRSNFFSLLKLDRGSHCRIQRKHDPIAWESLALGPQLPRVLRCLQPELGARYAAGRQHVTSSVAARLAGYSVLAVTLAPFRCIRVPGRAPNKHSQRLESPIRPPYPRLGHMYTVCATRYVVAR